MPRPARRHAQVETRRDYLECSFVSCDRVDEPAEQPLGQRAMVAVEFRRRDSHKRLGHHVLLGAEVLREQGEVRRHLPTLGEEDGRGCPSVEDPEELEHIQRDRRAAIERAERHNEAAHVPDAVAAQADRLCLNTDGACDHD